LLRGP